MEQPLSQQAFQEDLSFENEDTLPGASWIAPEYHHFEKTRDWYLGFGIISATIAIISALMGNWVFAILVLVASFALALFAHRPPRAVQVHMGVGGIQIEKTVYEFKELDSFWVELEENREHPKIIFKSKKLWMPYIAIPLGNMDANDVADFLANFLPEVEMKEPLLQRIAEDFGF
jgi:hypothetical protein